MKDVYLEGVTFVICQNFGMLIANINSSHLMKVLLHPPLSSLRIQTSCGVSCKSYYFLYSYVSFLLFYLVSESQFDFSNYPKDYTDDILDCGSVTGN